MRSRPPVRIFRARCKPTALPWAFAIRSIAIGRFLAACDLHGECYQAAVHALNNASEIARRGMASRRQVHKAGETVVKQIRFLLGLKDVPGDDADRYFLEIPNAPPQTPCDFSPLNSTEWQPAVNCDAGDLEQKCMLSFTPVRDSCMASVGFNVDESVKLICETTSQCREDLDAWLEKCSTTSGGAHYAELIETCGARKCRSDFEAFMACFETPCCSNIEALAIPAQKSCASFPPGQAVQFKLDFCRTFNAHAPSGALGAIGGLLG